MCIVVMVVVVIRVVVVSSSMGIRDRGFLNLERPAADEGCKAVVRSPGEIAIPVDSVGTRPGTACVGLVVVPARSKALTQCDLQKAFTYNLNVNASTPYLFLSTPCSAGLRGSGRPEGRSLEMP